MTEGILRKKVGMTQIFTESGEFIPVTIIGAAPNVMLQVKTAEMDGYKAVQVGLNDKRRVLGNRLAKGHVVKANTVPKRLIRKSKNIEGLEAGQEITVDAFEVGDVTDVTGTSKGKGSQGVIKRRGQARGPVAHGSRYYHRPGSVGLVAPNRVLENKYLVGRIGGNRMTIQNLEVVQITPEKSVILIKGNIPGVKKPLIIIESAVKVVK